MIQIARETYGAADDLLEASLKDSEEVYLLYEGPDGEGAAPRAQAALGPFELCERLDYDDGSVIERYISRDFDCALFTASDRLQVEYDNGARLEHVLLESNQDVLDSQFLWRNLPSEPHSISLQVFDDAGARVLGQDALIGGRSLARHRLDISALAPGNYAVKLIVYNFQTGQSVSGKLGETSVRFDRALEIAAINRS